MSDGGEGLLDAVGGQRHFDSVTGPLGEPVVAEWRLLEEPGQPSTAVIEMAQASGLTLAGGRERNDPLRASTVGTGELIQAAMDAGAQRIIVGCGGSASTDGGSGAIAAIKDRARLALTELIVATDVRTQFVDAAAVFGPQKGADAASIILLEERLRSLATRYQEDFGRPIEGISGSGAAGGLAGGLAALGARIVSGFDYVAELLGLEGALRCADAVVTGEGRLDETSFQGKVTGGVLDLLTGPVPTLIVVGIAEAGPDRINSTIEVLSLSERFGFSSALDQPEVLVRQVVAEWLRRLN